MSVRGRVRITQTLIEDVICDPVIGARWICGVDLDAFQRARLKINWWVPETIDDSGISSGKTIGFVVYTVLRALLLVNYTDGHDVGVYPQIFQAGKDVYWRELERLLASSMLLRNETCKPLKHPSCWTLEFKGGGRIDMPAPDKRNEAEGQAGRRYNTLGVDEWTKWDASGNGINAELIGRNSRSAYQKRHPIWSNHYKFLAHAEVTTHPSQKRFDNFAARIAKGNPRVAIQRWSFKDWSKLRDSSGRTYQEMYRDELTIEASRNNDSPAEFVAKAGGVRMVNGVGWYTGDALAAMEELGRVRGVNAMCGRDRNPTETPSGHERN